jgi:hexosaminidase
MTTRKHLTGLIVAALSALVLLAVSCTKKEPSDLTKAGIIPKPVSVTATGGYFTLNSESAIYVRGESKEAVAVGHYLSDHLKPATGFSLEVKSAPEKAQPGSVWLTLSADASKNGNEEYSLIITKDDVNISASTAAGLFMGVQTLRQLFPAAVEMNTVQPGPWEIATGTISDYPQYAYRGAMLDVARHFFQAAEVKIFIDEISYYKMNYLHLHLSDDQGWRIEIKSWPNLTAHGSLTQVGGGKGGFYTQDEYSDIVKYAAERYVTIVPEIDMPGHTGAALASYGELNCDGKARELYTGTEVGLTTFCTKKPVVFKFIADVIKEITSLSPGPYFHIGGDESHSTKKEDYIPFMEKVQDMVIASGKIPLAWDEIATTKLRPGTVAQDWASIKNAAEAVSKGSKLLMSPANKAYIDMQYDSTSKFGLHWAAYIEVDSAYIWDPAKLIPGVGKENIIGVEAPLWSETITNIDEIEYLAFPRLPGIAEIGWTPASLRDWNEYKVRLASHGARMKAMGIDFYPSKLISWEEKKK